MSSFTFREPKRENAPILAGFAGGTGSGKTMSALLLARGLAGGKPFAVIDTENGRALHYTDYFPDMRHGYLRAPFSPVAYTEAIKAADEQGFPVVVVDSTSHIWEGEGGVLEMQVAEFKRLGSREAVKMLSWAAPKQAHKEFVRALLQMKAHVILNFRAEDKIEMVKVGDRTEVRAKQSLTSIDGWIPICEKRLPFELTLSFLFTADKPGVPKPIKLQEQHKPFFPLDRQITEEAGVALARWAAGGQVPVAAVESVAGNVASDSDVDAVLAIAREMGGDVLETTKAAFASHREKHGHVDRSWLVRLSDALVKKAGDQPAVSPFQAPVSVSS